jgi:hypothetical protein
MERIKEAEAEFKSLMEAIDPTTVSGTTMMMQLIAVFAQFERSVLAERTKAGLDAARKRGCIGGRRPKLRPNQQDEIVTMASTGNPPHRSVPSSAFVKCLPIMSRGAGEMRRHTAQLGGAAARDTLPNILWLIAETVCQKLCIANQLTGELSYLSL